MKEFKFIIDGLKYEVSVDERENNQAEVVVNGKSYTVELEKEEAAAQPAARPTTTTAAAPAATGAVETIKSPLPGSIIKVLVSAGQSVKRGDVLLTMESMKMENNVTAEKDGVIKTIFVTPGQNVMQEDKLIEFAGVAAAPVEARSAAAPAPKTEPVAAPKPAAAPVAGGFKVTSPLPGSVVKVVAQIDQEVKRGDLLIVLESMKMENNIMAEKDGKVTAINVAAGQSVMQDDLLMVIG